MKYRICKNKYGWWKIQEYRKVSVCNVSSNPFRMLWYFISGNWSKEKYVWKDEFGNQTYRTKEDAEIIVQIYLEGDIERKERNNNEWECQGEY